MIIKSASRKSVSFGQVVRYINEPKEKGSQAVFHNLTPTNNLSIIEKEFLKNYSYSQKRKNGIVLYHEILSFSGNDKEHINLDIMNDIAQKYLEIRAGEAIGYGKAHFNTDNPHIHCLISSNLIESEKKLRLSKFQFARTKKEIEKYQQKKYPELEHSIVFSRSEEKNKGKPQVKQSFKESERARRLQKEGIRAQSQAQSQSKKEQVLETVFDCLTNSYSQNEFVDRLKNLGFEFYLRGKTAGVKEIDSNKKYRLKTLGIDKFFEEAQERWNRRKERSKRLDSIEFAKLRKQWLAFNTKGFVMSVLNGKGKNITR